MAYGGSRRRTEPLAVIGPDRAGPVALVVDDEAEMRETLRLSLSLEGWVVEEAASGEAAVEHWKRVAPDVVLLDQNLLGMSGLECAAQLRELSSDARIILFSAYLDDHASKEARRLRLLPLEKADRRRLREVLGMLAEQISSSRSAVG
jgi:CheY-like chemotaxis protein